MLLISAVIVFLDPAFDLDPFSRACVDHFRKFDWHALVAPINSEIDVLQHTRSVIPDRLIGECREVSVQTLQFSSEGFDY